MRRNRTSAIGRVLPAILCALGALPLAGCGGAGHAPEMPELPERHIARRGKPTVAIIGIDGADWKVIRRLQAEGGLPNLARLEKEGIASPLKTDYGSSPVIWTTIATGRRPDAHGITDFVVATPQGTVPVSSSLRRVPALWNMASRAGLRTAILGWWASWPAEPIRGLVVTDRAHLGDDRIVFPPGYLPTLVEQRNKAFGEHPDLAGGIPTPDTWMEDGAFRDRIMAREARRLAGREFDLLMVYFRTVDIASHRYWKYFEPESYADVDPAMIAAAGRVIPSVYEATDRILGEILESLPVSSNVFVLSDHGFLAGPEVHFVYLNTAILLERLGLLVTKDGAVDFARSTAYPFESPEHSAEKKIRISLAGREPGGAVPPERLREEIDRVASALEGLTYDNGEPLFRLRRDDGSPDADLVAVVNVHDPTMKVRHGAETWDGVVNYINRISGTHNEHTDGIFLARGPDLLPGASAEGISILDVAPTILYALGLPVAEDFAGTARTDLFTPAFRDAHPPRSVPTWGTMESWKVETSPEDSRLIEELRALGYL